MRTERLTYACTLEEKQALERIAALWRRSRSDTIRLLIASALEQLFATEQQAPESQPASYSTTSSTVNGKRGAASGLGAKS